MAIFSFMGPRATTLSWSRTMPAEGEYHVDFNGIIYRFAKSAVNGGDVFYGHEGNDTFSIEPTLWLIVSAYGMDGNDHLLAAE